MGIGRQIARSSAIAVGTLVVGGLLDVFYVGVLCPKAARAQQAARHEPVVIDSGFRFALPGEMIVSCTTPHRLGPVAFHEDLDCYCVPASTDVVALGSRVGGNCTVDKATPTRADTGGICRHAHCEDFR